jgi:hypothetical protein
MIALKSTYLLMRMHMLRLSRYPCKGVAVGKGEIRKTVHISANYMGLTKIMSIENIKPLLSLGTVSRRFRIQQTD